MNLDELLRAGRVSFLGQEILVAPGTLVPRPETEILGRTAIELLRERGWEQGRVIDMCCGAGNLACAIAAALPAVRVWAADLTDECAALTRRNAERLGLADRITVAKGDLFAAFAGADVREVDLVVCNPPYISEGKLQGERADLLTHEPRVAFDGGPYGIRIHQRVIKEALPFLRTGGGLMMEFGVGQERQVAQLFRRARAYGEVEFVADAENRARVALAEKQATSSQ